MSSNHSPSVNHQPPIIGLLGGSFNPAHPGHVHISIEAHKRLNAPIWWMVTPQNPLKKASDIADFQTRFDHARALAAPYPFITVTDIERKLGTNYTVATLQRLKIQFPRTRFVWLMGADNLASLHHWEQWTKLFTLCPVLILDRAPLSHKSLRSKAAERFGRYRLQDDQLKFLPYLRIPAWGYVHMRLSPESSTQLRKTLGKSAFLGHNEN